MKELKSLSKTWAQKKKEADDLSLQEAERAIISFEEDSGGVLRTQE